MQTDLMIGAAAHEPTPVRWFVWFVIIATLVFVVPYVFAALAAPAGLRFTGTHAISPADLPVYFSYIEQVAQGKTIFRDLFTSEAHSPFIFSPIWLVIGLIRKWSGASALLSFHVARAILIPVFLIVLERWLRAFLPAWRDRRLGIFLITFGAGFAVFVAPLALHFAQGIEMYWPMDLWVSEAYGFLTLYQTPHFIAATILLLLTLSWFSEGLVTKRTKNFAWSGLALLALTSFHPFHLVTIAAVCGFQVAYIWWLERKFPLAAIRGGLIVLGLAMPMIVYQALLLFWNPIAMGRAAENVNHTPAWWIVLLSFGLFIPLAAIGLVRKFPQADRRYRLLAIWLIVQYLVFTIPSIFNRRLTQGWQLPLAVFAVLGLRWAIGRFRMNQFPRSALVVMWLGVFSLSPIIVLREDVAYWTTAKYHSYPYNFYIDTAYQSVADWLKANTPPEAVVLAGEIGSLYIPALAGRTVVMGHTVETLDFWSKRREFDDRFLFHPSASGAENFIVRERVDFVLWGGAETAKYALTPDQLPNLAPVFNAGPLTLYTVSP